MGVPFEALLPYGIIIGLFGVTGVGLSTLKYYSNGRKNPRRGIDAWDQTNSLIAKPPATQLLIQLFKHSSDGTRPTAYRPEERTDKQPCCTPRLRIQQPMEGMAG
ncbi:hypothetical protein MGYG_06841 [Nannizzia gypsea CBS 118893]|uniref:NADH dehydrogenase [ubiquinone] 1 alpha subcomplex subunit 1 n=1 Tax=Arthroderma gypseum (strain ATCC MYA-4604 / CBS 118893) TaxID=535722 RepID=E4V1C6_ARTGP|nr:hypothetical protein MGYG_06841 [Nannizzia gypsea CBS 118893]EFR03841.1 hypothetical protein MGYG_06841 [Nannizzia gypsea CBS 118893]